MSKRKPDPWRAKLAHEIDGWRRLLAYYAESLTDAELLEIADDADDMLSSVLELADSGEPYAAACHALTAARLAGAAMRPGREREESSDAQTLRGRAKGKSENAKLRSARDAKMRAEARRRIAAGEQAGDVAQDLARRFNETWENARKIMREPAKRGALGKSRKTPKAKAPEP